MIGHLRLLLPFVLTASILPVSSAFARDTIPPNCENECRRQYIALSELDPDTSQRYIEQAFGAPLKEANRDSLLITMYRGVYADLFVISERRRKDRIAFAVTVRNLNPENAKYVATPLLWLEKRNLTDITMKNALPTCRGDVKFAHLKLGLAWTPACYFGAPGSYEDYSFLLYMNGADCDKSIGEDIPSFEKLRCQSLENAVPAVGLFVTLNSEMSKNGAGLTKILKTVSEFIWPCC
jgi:hypothetical protein